MQNLQNNPNQPPQCLLPTPLKTPFQYVQLFGDFVKSAVLALFWGIIGCAAVALTTVSLAAIYWMVKITLRALGG